MTYHALLSASSSKRWLTCTPSARLAEKFPDKDNAPAQEGTLGHAFFENHLLAHLGRPLQPLPQDLMHFDTPELREAAKDAAGKAIERIEYAKSVCNDPVFLVEQRLDYSPWAPEGSGTGDLVIVGHNYVEVLDAKFGAGVFVSAHDNSQFRLYMLGAYHQFGSLYDIEFVRGTVLQPRLNNYSSEELSLDALLEWGENFVVPRAKLAWAGEGEFVPGEHCSSAFCKARFTCAARANANLAIAQQEFALVAPELLTDAQIATVLDKAEQAIKWLTDVQSYALEQASNGHHYPGFKLVEGVSRRKYTDIDAVAATLQANGVPEEIIFERSLLGITAMEKAIGKKEFARLLSDFVEKPAGKPTLARESDKRPAITTSAAADFS